MGTRVDALLQKYVDGMKLIEFDYMHKDIKVAHVEADPAKQVIKQEVFGDNLLDRPMVRDTPTMKDLMAFFETRCFPKERDNTDKLLKSLGLTVYNPYLICMKTRGRLWDDFYWIRFRGDTVTYDEIKLRD